MTILWVAPVLTRDVLMAKESDIFWLNDEEKTRFGEHGLKRFEDMWSVAEDNPMVTRLHRTHSDRHSGRVLRWIFQLEAGGRVYFLKRACAWAFPSVLNEFEAINAIRELGVRSAEVTARSFDHQRKRGFLLLENLNGYVAFKQLAEAKVAEQTVEKFACNKDRFLEALLKVFFRIRGGGYFYPDWRDKHIFFDLESGKIALIDLERLVHVSKLPWYYRTKLFRSWKYWGERRTLFRSLSSGFYSQRTLRQTFDRVEHEE